MNPIAEAREMAGENLSADDLAALRDEQFRASALSSHRARASLVRHASGTCSYCGEGCAADAVYCDAECRADHEHEQLVLARQGRAAR